MWWKLHLGQFKDGINEQDSWPYVTEITNTTSDLSPSSPVCLRNEGKERKGKRGQATNLHSKTWNSADSNRL